MPVSRAFIAAAMAAMLLLAPVAAVGQSDSGTGEQAPLNIPSGSGDSGDGSGAPAPPSGSNPADQQQSTNTNRSGGGLGDMFPLILMLGAFFLLWFWMNRGRSKEHKRRAEMLGALKKGDKITTVGGVIGTVIEVKGDEVVVKVDESANVRMKFARWAIRGVGDAAKVEDPKQAVQGAPKQP